eukprot:TRINITY_DN30099_c0_g1_i1.p1 TRINITY_DN30099_c0_g1~~TRINITY_DN30099_c0_g1_i1.p1  ORF type:complete len:387 (+),score=42.11 TRINITY_DN30099_c0_g1_i1:61-1161(+)
MISARRWARKPGAGARRDCAPFLVLLAFAVHLSCRTFSVPTTTKLQRVSSPVGHNFGASRSPAPSAVIQSQRSSASGTALQAVSAWALLAACSLPACLGFWKSEYGVSYGYGGAMAVSGYLLLREAGMPWLVALHAACLALYGVRLSVFLLCRELCLEKFREMRERIETKAKGRGGRAKRTPFILSCGLLYFGMVAPSVLVMKASDVGADLAGPGAAAVVFRVCLAAMYVGLLLNTSGDLYKSASKALRGESALVTDGLFFFLRHPNYTGEQLLWTASFFSGLAATAAVTTRQDWLWSNAGWLALSSLGVLGILFVLMQATGGLEAKQKEAHAGNEEYDCWISRSWPGLSLARKAAAPAFEGEGGD